MLIINTLWNAVFFQYHSLSCDFDCISAIALQSVADVATPFFLYIFFLKNI